MANLISECKYSKRQGVGRLTMCAQLDEQGLQSLQKVSIQIAGDATTKKVEVHFSDLDRLGLAPLQVFIALRNTMLNEGRELVFQNTGSRLNDELSMAGLG